MESPSIHHRYCEKAIISSCLLPLSQNKTTCKTFDLTFGWYVLKMNVKEKNVFVLMVLHRLILTQKGKMEENSMQPVINWSRSQPLRPRSRKGMGGIVWLPWVTAKETSDTQVYYSSTSGQDGPNPVLWLATQAGKVGLPCPPGMAICITQEFDIL